MKRTLNVFLVAIMITFIDCKTDHINEVQKIDDEIISDYKENIATGTRASDEIMVQSDFEKRFIEFRRYAIDQIKSHPEEEIRFKTDTSKIVRFKTSKEFLYIRLSQNTWKHTLEFYEIEEKEPRLVWKENWEDLSFIGDTIRDINGDGELDILTNFYPNSGCCRRNSYWIRVYNIDRGNFEKKFRLINPTFYPKEKIIRGVKYGHPGEVPLYKMNWTGNKLDTIEYIYPVRGKKDKFVVTNYSEKDTERGKASSRKVVSSIPREYRGVEDIDWFMNY